MRAKGTIDESSGECHGTFRGLSLGRLKTLARTCSLEVWASTHVARDSLHPVKLPFPEQTASTLHEKERHRRVY